MLTRAQLAAFLTDPRTIREFEQLAQQTANTPDTLDGVAIAASAASARAGEAIAAINRLAAALESMPPAQQDVSIATDYVDFPISGPHVTKARRLQWNGDDGTLDVGLNDEVTLQIGQEILYYAKNTSGGAIANGTPVMFTGAVGASGKLTFGKAVADGSVASDAMMGVATEDIENNAFGYITAFGLVRGFNTSGGPYGESWADGDLLYFGATAGTWTNVKPTAPAITVPVAVVVNAATGDSGSIMVRMRVNDSIAGLQDVHAPTPSTGQVLAYAGTRWEPLTLGTMAAQNTGASGTFTTADSKTVTVTNGIITSIV